MALEQEEPKQEGSSTLSKVLWGAAIAGAAVGAVMVTPAVLNGVGSVAQSTADYFTAPGGASVGSSTYTTTGEALHSFAEGAKSLGKDVSTTLSNVFSSSGAAATATAEATKTATDAATDKGILNTAKETAGKVGEKISTGFSALTGNPGATATIAGSAIAGAGVGLGVKSWAQRVGQKKDYETMAARIEAERSQQGVTGPAIG